MLKDKAVLHQVCGHVQGTTTRSSWALIAALAHNEEEDCLIGGAGSTASIEPPGETPVNCSAPLEVLAVLIVWSASQPGAMLTIGARNSSVQGL